MPTPPPTPLRIALLAACTAPVLWGISWIGISEYMPDDRPFLAAALRALPTGLVLLAIVRRLPAGAWWWRTLVLGTLNFGIFFALLSIAAYRVPGGVGATMGAVQPLIIAALGIPLLSILPTRRQIVAGLVGIVGVSMLVLGPDAALDLIGVAAALGAVASMALGVVLSKRWADPDVTPLVSIAWQLTVAGLLLTPAAFIAEGTPPAPTGDTVIAVLFVGLLCTGVGNWLWFVGLSGIPATRASFLTLIAPIVATAMGWALLDQSLSPLQLLGGAVALGSVAAGQGAHARSTVDLTAESPVPPVPLPALSQH
ncbi:MAG: Protein pecM [Thermoleophilia bacterium]|nr:Protein pecM [Thermoleophilia bacterium]